MSQVYIVDTTLRDGEQTPEVVFLKEEKMKIAKKLDNIGVGIIEVGIPAMGSEEMEAIYAIGEMGLHAEILTWNRMNKKDIDCSLACGIKNIHISISASDIQIKNKLNKDRNWVMEKIKEVVSYGHDQGCTISVGAEDASRADMNFLLQFYQTAMDYGAKRVRYADTLGLLDPFKTYQIIENIKKELAADIDFHGHNDFGLATANAMAAWEAGAKYISCSVNGIGERAGNTALEEIVMALKHMKKIETGINIREVKQLSKLVEEASGRIVSEGKPIIGSKIFWHESGIHADGVIKNPINYEPFDPDEIGGERKLVIGKHSGTGALLHYFKNIGYPISQEKATQALKKIRKHFTVNKKIAENWLMNLLE